MKPKFAAPSLDTDYLTITIMFEVTVNCQRILVGSSASGVIAPGGSEETSAKKYLEHMRNIEKRLPWWQVHRCHHRLTGQEVPLSQGKAILTGRL